MHVGTLRQILLITDGQSNKGKNPVAMAAEASEEGYTINVIGITGKEGILTDAAQMEIESIANAGKGISQVVMTKQLSQTVQMVTKQAMTQTLYGVMNRQLKKILGKEQSLEDLSPQKRMEVVEVVDDYSEQVSLELVVLVDCSGSMYDKLQAVKEALVDLSISLDARMGNNEYKIYIFPGKKEDVEQLIEWTHDLSNIERIFPKLCSGGMTPTGAALGIAIQALRNKKNIYRSYLADEGSCYGELE